MADQNQQQQDGNNDPNASKKKKYKHKFYDHMRGKINQYPHRQSLVTSLNKYLLRDPQNNNSQREQLLNRQRKLMLETIEFYVRQFSEIIVLSQSVVNLYIGQKAPEGVPPEAISKELFRKANRIVSSSKQNITFQNRYGNATDTPKCNIERDLIEIRKTFIDPKRDKYPSRTFLSHLLDANNGKRFSNLLTFYKTNFIRNQRKSFRLFLEELSYETKELPPDKVEQREAKWIEKRKMKREKEERDRERQSYVSRKRKKKKSEETPSNIQYEANRKLSDEKVKKRDEFRKKIASMKSKDDDPHVAKVYKKLRESTFGSDEHYTKCLNECYIFLNNNKNIDTMTTTQHLNQELKDKINKKIGDHREFLNGLLSIPVEQFDWSYENVQDVQGNDENNDDNTTEEQNSYFKNLDKKHIESWEQGQSLLNPTEEVNPTTPSNNNNQVPVTDLVVSATTLKHLINNEKHREKIMPLLMKYFAFLDVSAPAPQSKPKAYCIHITPTSIEKNILKLHKKLHENSPHVEELINLVDDELSNSEEDSLQLITNPKKVSNQSRSKYFLNNTYYTNGRKLCSSYQRTLSDKEIKDKKNRKKHNEGFYSFIKKKKGRNDMKLKSSYECQYDSGVYTKATELCPRVYDLWKDVTFDLSDDDTKKLFHNENDIQYKSTQEEGTLYNSKFKKLHVQPKATPLNQRPQEESTNNESHENMDPHHNPSTQNESSNNESREMDIDEQETMVQENHEVNDINTSTTSTSTMDIDNNDEVMIQDSENNTSATSRNEKRPAATAFNQNDTNRDKRPRHSSPTRNTEDTPSSQSSQSITNNNATNPASSSNPTSSSDQRSTIYFDIEKSNKIITEQKLEELRRNADISDQSLPPNIKQCIKIKPSSSNNDQTTNNDDNMNNITCEYVDPGKRLLFYVQHSHVDEKALAEEIRRKEDCPKNEKRKYEGKRLKKAQNRHKFFRENNISTSKLSYKEHFHNQCVKQYNNQVMIQTVKQQTDYTDIYKICNGTTKHKFNVKKYSEYLVKILDNFDRCFDYQFLPFHRKYDLQRHQKHQKAEAIARQRIRGNKKNGKQICFWGNARFPHNSKGSPSAPNLSLQKCLSKEIPVVRVSEYLTSQFSCCCHAKLSKAKGYGVSVCSSCKTIMNRDHCSAMLIGYCTRTRIQRKYVGPLTFYPRDKNTSSNQ